MRRLLGVPPLVGPPVDAEAVPAAGCRDELPGPGRLRHGVRLGREPAFDQRDVDEVLGEAVPDEDLLHHPDILPRAGQVQFEPLPSPGLEVADELLDRAGDPGEDTPLPFRHLLRGGGEELFPHPLSLFRNVLEVFRHLKVDLAGGEDQVGGLFRRRRDERDRGDGGEPGRHGGRGGGGRSGSRRGGEILRGNRRGWSRGDLGSGSCGNRPRHARRNRRRRNGRGGRRGGRRFPGLRATGIDRRSPCRRRRKSVRGHPKRRDRHEQQKEPRRREGVPHDPPLKETSLETI